MRNSLSTEFDARRGRAFGLQVGTAFLLLGGLLLWRERMLLAIVSGGVGVVLWSGGLAVPGRLGPLYRGWMAMALAVSKVTTPVFLGIVYFLVLTPTGLVMRGLGRNPLKRPAGAPTYWVRTEDVSDMRRQF